MSIINGLLSYYSAFGLAGVYSAVSHRWTGSPSRIRVKAPGIQHPLIVRPGTTDHRAFRNIFREHEYRFAPHSPPSTIIDAGANVGFASVYFANKWPGARIIAIEPEPSNFDIMVQNVWPYPRVEPLHAAVWKENTRLDIFDPGNGSWGMRTKVSTDGRVNGLTIPEIMRRFDMPTVDVLKVDIEGAERDVFEGAAEWIDRVGTLVIEIHGPEAKASVMKVADRFPEIYDNGVDTWYLTKGK